MPLRRNRDFQLLWGGQAVSVMGSQISKIAYPLLVLALTGSPAKAGIAGSAAMLGYLLFPLPAGALADRFDRKRMMIACDAIRLAAVGSIALAGSVAHISYVQVLVTGFVEGSASVFFSLAQRAALPMIVHVSQRSVAVSQNEARNFGALLAGPAVGGSLFGLSQAAPFAADALTYVASLATLPFIKAPMQERSRDAPRASAQAVRGALVRDLREGLAWTWREPFLRYSAFFAGAVNVLLQVLTLGLIVLARHDGASAAETGFIVACYGVGGLAGAFVAPWVQRRLPAGLTITGCMWVWALPVRSGGPDAMIPRPPKPEARCALAGALSRGPWPRLAGLSRGWRRRRPGRAAAASRHTSDRRAAGRRNARGSRSSRRESRAAPAGPPAIRRVHR